MEVDTIHYRNDTNIECALISNHEIVFNLVYLWDARVALATGESVLWHDDNKLRLEVDTILIRSDRQIHSSWICLDPEAASKLVEFILNSGIIKHTEEERE